MKKRIIVLVAMLLVVSALFAGCAKTNLNGTYKLIKLEVDGNVIEGEEADALAYSVMLEDDEKLSLIIQEEITEGKYLVNEDKVTFVIDGTITYGTFKGDTIIMGMTGSPSISTFEKVE